VDLRPQLGGELLVVGGERGDMASFLDRVGQGLFAIDMLAEGQRQGGRPGVSVVGGRDHDGVDPLLFRIEHLAVIAVLGRLGKLTRRRAEVSGVHIAQRDDVLAGELFDIVPALVGDADAGDVQFLVG
jgi:hypothetical protein